MLIRDLLLPHSPWPSLLLHWALLPLWGFIQFAQGEIQKSCSRSSSEKVSESCQQVCQCRLRPPFPPPPPPPLPPRLIIIDSPPAPVEGTLWNGLVIIIAVCCATVVFILVVVIICYKAIKRKPLRKEENGTSRAEYAMSPQNKVLDANNAVV